MTIRAFLVGLAAIGFVGATSAQAEPVKCQRDLAKASAKYVQGRAKALDKCENAKTKAKLPPATVCETEAKTLLTLGKLDQKLTLSIGKSCGGADKTCGNGDDDTLASIGWNIGTCPDFESSGCANVINNCTDITTCLKCIHDVAVDQAIALYYASLQQSEFGSNSAVNKCQQAIGKATAKFLGARSKALQKCWDARLKGDHALTCPADNTGKTNLLIGKAETKKVDTICKACGGADKLCGGGDDLTPASIGFVGTCPTAETFDATSCAGPVADATALVGCVDCVTEFKTDCMDAAAVPAFLSPLPAVCNPNATTTSTSTSTTSTSSSTTTSSATTSSSTSTTTTSTTTSTSSTLATTTSTSTSSSTTTTSTSTSTTSTSTSTTTTSTSTSSSSTSTTTSTTTTSSSTSSSTTTTSTSTSTTTTTIGSGPTALDFLSTAGSGACGTTFRDVAGTIPLKNLLCANLSLGGGLSQVPDNATPPGATNRFSLSCTGPNCTVGSLSPATPTYDCSATGCFFGTPLPITNAGLSVCVTNRFSAPASGTLNTSTGDLTMNFQLTSTTILTGLPAQPCPRCAVSVGGAACVGTFASPCTGVCDGSPNQGAVCASRNSFGVTGDCPAPAAITGASRCFRGTNNNAICSTGGDCPGGVCAQFIGDIAISLNPLTTGTASTSSAAGTFCPGQTASQKGAFRSDICRTGANIGAPCIATSGAAENVDAANCGAGGLCRPGTLNNFCSGGANDGDGCLNATGCPSGTCLRAGTLVQLIREVGVPAGAMALSVPKAVKLGSTFCVSNTASPLVNSNANLPGPGATSITANITLIP